MGDSEKDGYLKRFAKWVFSPFINTSKEEVGKYKVLSKGDNVDQSEGVTFLNILPENFLLGSAWGLISGYSSGVFFEPVPDKVKALKYLGFTKKLRFLKILKQYDFFYPSYVAMRAIRRGTLGGFVFDQAEQKTANNLGMGHSTTSTLVGLAVLSIFFRVSTNLRHSIITSSTILGGYLVGSQVLKLVRSGKQEPAASQEQGDPKRDE